MVSTSVHHDEGNEMFEPGQRIRTSGLGRTANWPDATGTVKEVFEDGSPVVVWDGEWIEDEMDPSEVEAL